MQFPPAWWRTYRAAFWAGPDYLQGGVRRKKHLLATIAGTVWLAGSLRRKLTLPALLLLPVCGMIMLYCLIVQQAFVLCWLYFLLSCAVTALVTSFIFRPRGTLERSLPERVRKGERFRVKFHLRNRRPIPCYEVRMDPFDYSPCLKCLSPAELPRIGGGGEAACEAEVLACRRGAVRFYRAIGESAFPLGLVKWSLRGKTEQKLLIYPAFTPLETFQLPPGAVIRSSGTAISTLPGESPDLLGSRDFRPGDAIRHIDWPGSARKGDLVVKEFAREEWMRIALLVDCCPPKARPIPANGESPELEAALSLAVAVADRMLRQGTSVDLLAAGGELHRISGDRQQKGFRQVCDILAEVTPDPEFQVSALKDTLQTEWQTCAAAVLLLLDDTPERRKFAEVIAANGVPLKIILISRRRSSAGPLPENWRLIRPEQIVGGSVTSL